jgi:hypothetical protein
MFRTIGCSSTSLQFVTMVALAQRRQASQQVDPPLLSPFSAM